MGDHWDYTPPPAPQNVVTPLLATSKTTKEDGVTVSQLVCQANVLQLVCQANVLQLVCQANVSQLF